MATLNSRHSAGKGLLNGQVDGNALGAASLLEGAMEGNIIFPAF